MNFPVLLNRKQENTRDARAQKKARVGSVETQKNSEQSQTKQDTKFGGADRDRTSLNFMTTYVCEQDHFEHQSTIFKSNTKSSEREAHESTE